MIRGTVILAAIVVILDYTLHFTGTKIPFPPYPGLEFDLDGVPIVLSLLLYGPYSAVATSFVAFVAILARSGDIVGASMKGLAEFATIIGLLLFYKSHSRGRRALAVVSGTLSRVLVMALAMIMYNPLEKAIALLPISVTFNVIAAIISILGGYLVYSVLSKRKL